MCPEYPNECPHCSMSFDEKMKVSVMNSCIQYIMVVIHFVCFVNICI